MHDYIVSYIVLLKLHHIQHMHTILSKLHLLFIYKKNGSLERNLSQRAFLTTFQQLGIFEY